MYVQILDKAIMNDINGRAVEQAMRPFSSSEFHVQKLHERVLSKTKLDSESRKHYNRHVADQMAVKRKSYSVYAYFQEDNYLLEPLDIGNIYFHIISTNKDQPFVVVDQPCEFFEAYSDKAYIANKPGADILSFGITTAEFFQRLKQYILFSYYSAIEKIPRTLMQPEAFVHDSLSTAHVEKINMRRVDMRYMYKDQRRCIPKLYYDCMPTKQTRDLATQQGLLSCEKKKAP